MHDVEHDPSIDYQSEEDCENRNYIILNQTYHVV